MRHLNSLKKYWPWTIAILLFVILIVYINNSTANILYADQFRFVHNILVKYYSGNLSLSDLWKADGIQRPFGYFPIFIFNSIIFKLNSYVEMYLGVFCLFLSSLIIIRYFYKSLNLNQKQKSVPFFIIILVVSIVMSLDQWELLIYGNGVALFLRMLIFLLTFISFERLMFSNSRFNIFTFLIMMILSLLFGAAYLYSFSLCLIVAVTINLMTSNKTKILLKRSAYVIVITGLMLFIYSKDLYVTNNFGAGQDHLLEGQTFNSIINHPVEFVNFLILAPAANIIGVDVAVNHGIPKGILIVIGILLIFVYFVATFCFLKYKIYKISYMPILLILYAIINYVIISIGRFVFSTQYPLYSMSSRYTLDTHYGLIGILMIISILLKLQTRKKLYYFNIFTTIFILFGLLITNKEEWRISPYRKIYFNDLVETAKKYDGGSTQGLGKFNADSTQLVQEGLIFLKAHKLNVYSE